jgi:hypothetical protein
MADDDAGDADFGFGLLMNDVRDVSWVCRYYDGEGVTTTTYYNS